MFFHQSISPSVFTYLIKFNITNDTKEITKFKDEMQERIRGIEQILLLNEASRKQCFASNTRNRKVGVRGRQGQVIGCLTLRRNRVRNRLHFW